MLVGMGSASSAAFPHMVRVTYHLLYSFQMFAKSCKKGRYLIHSSQAAIIHRMHVNDNWSNCVNIQEEEEAQAYSFLNPDLEIIHS